MHFLSTLSGFSFCETVYFVPLENDADFTAHHAMVTPDNMNPAEDTYIYYCTIVLLLENDAASYSTSYNGHSWTT